MIGSALSTLAARELAALASNASLLTLAVQRHPRHGDVLLRLQVFRDSLPGRDQGPGTTLELPADHPHGVCPGLVGQTLTPLLSQVRLPVTVARGSRDRSSRPH